MQKIVPKKRDPLAYVVGAKRGKLTILSRDPSGTPKYPKFNVRCDCGNEYLTTQANLHTARGCSLCNRGGAKRKYKNGHRTNENRLYLTWSAMRHRCRSDHPKNASWNGRGIIVCPEWENSFEVFEKWALANNWRAGLSIDRIDVDGNYEPYNCEWVTRSVNSKRARAEYRSVRRNKDLFGLERYLPIEALFGGV